MRSGIEYLFVHTFRTTSVCARECLAQSLRHDNLRECSIWVFSPSTGCRKALSQSRRLFGQTVNRLRYPSSLDVTAPILTFRHRGQSRPISALVTGGQQECLAPLKFEDRHGRCRALSVPTRAILDASGVVDLARSAGKKRHI